MVQDQLIDYISSQIKLGTSRDAIKAALLGAGWAAADVDDSFKKFEGASPAAKPMQPAQPVAVSSPATKPVSSGPQVIRMSDLVSASDGPVATISREQKPAVKMAAMGAVKPAAAAQEFSAAHSVGSSSKKPLLTWIVAGVLIVGLGGLTGYFYMQSASLSGQVSTLGGQSSNVEAEVTSLSAQVSALTASGTAMGTQLSGLTQANQELMTELSFYVAPPGSAPTSTKVSINGSLSVTAGKMYILTGSYGGKVVVANSKDAKVIAVLAPLVGSSTQLGGTYMPGTDMMTVTSVGGTAF